MRAGVCLWGGNKAAGLLACQSRVFYNSLSLLCRCCRPVLYRTFFCPVRHAHNCSCAPVAWRKHVVAQQPCGRCTRRRQPTQRAAVSCARVHARNSSHTNRVCCLLAQSTLLCRCGGACCVSGVMCARTRRPTHAVPLSAVHRCQRICMHMSTRTPDKPSAQPRTRSCAKCGHSLASAAALIAVGTRGTGRHHRAPTPTRPPHLHPPAPLLLAARRPGPCRRHLVPLAVAAQRHA